MPNIPQLALSDPITVTVASALPALSLNRSDLATTITITPSGTAAAPVAAFNSAITSSNGMPYNLGMTGTITTDSSGAATLSLTGWSWGDTTHQRMLFVMLGIYPSTPNSTQGWWCGLLIGAANSTCFSQGYESTTSSTINGSVTYGTNGMNGTRYFTLAGFAASTIYNYEMRAISPNSALSPSI